MKSNQQGSALILTVGFVALIVSLGSLFLVKASAKLDESITQKLAMYAEHAAETGFAHARQKIIEDYVNNEFTCYQSQYKLAFSALDTTGKPMHNMSAYVSPSQSADPDPRINAKNSDRVSLHQAEIYQNDYNSLSKWTEGYGLDEISNYNSRYHDVFFVDVNGNVVSDALSDYVVRYTIEIADENGKHSLNADYPGHPISFDFADPDKDEYLAYQSYLHRFGRAIRSMHGAVAHERQQQNININNHYATNYVNSQVHECIDVTGISVGLVENGTMQSDERVFYDQLFRGEGLIQQNSAGSRYWNARTYLAQTIPGKVFSYGQVLTHARNHSEQSSNYMPRQFSPYALGMRDKDWPIADQGYDPYIDNLAQPNCPWRVNIITATTYSLQSLIFGLSSHLRCEGNGRNWDKTGSNATMDLFGPNYPEGFPLSLDSGKSVHLIGGDTNAAGNIINGTKYLPYYPRFDRLDYIVPAAYRNSYWWDVAAAFYRATQVAKHVWNYQADPNNSTANANLKCYDPQSKILNIGNDLTKDPKAMMAQLESEFLRILGEDVVATYNSGSNEFEYTLGSGGLLATPLYDSTAAEGFATVGFGATADVTERHQVRRISSADDTDETLPILNKRRCRLRNGENTRAMEYLLNDVRMSIFGTPAINFNKDDISGNGSVSTLPNDEDAESTYNGWWDNGVRKWSWYYAGVPQTHDDALKWLEFPTWYRFWHDGTPHMARWNGDQWENRDADITLFFARNKAFLDAGFLGGASPRPIKPWSATGRIYCGQSQIFNIIVRGELYDHIAGRRVTQFTAEQFLHVDPNRDDDLSDTYIIYQRHFGRNKAHTSSVD